MRDQGIRAIARFVFKQGGVSSAVRRLVYQQRDVFTSAQIHGEFYRRWPHIQPGEFQIQDCLDSMRRRRAIEAIDCVSISIHYIRPKRLRQMKLKLRFK